MPITDLRPVIDDLLAGKTRRRDESESAETAQQPMTLSQLGIILIPDVLPKTPPFIERVPADARQRLVPGLQVDDLIVFVQTNLVGSCQELREELSYIDRLQPVRLTVLRDQQLLEFELTAEP